MSFLSAQYDPLVVIASLVIASLASYVALDLAKRVRAQDIAVGRAWWVAGSVVMGTGVWATHFVGMLAYSLPIQLGYTYGLTAISWLAAVAAAGVALRIASQARISHLRLLLGSLVMAGGICAMHYIGMAAIDVQPGIVWDIRWVALSVGVAWITSAVALFLLRSLTRVSGQKGVRLQMLAAVVMGAAICGMHYSGMAAAGFVEGVVCLSTDQLSGRGLGLTVMLFTVVILMLTLFISLLDARLRRRTVRLAKSLKEANHQLLDANAELHRRAFSDPLTDLPNRLLFDDRLSQALARCARQGGKMAVLFVDLDGFKPVNDLYGHAAGDAVLRDAAARVRRVARESDTVARVGGDEFVVLMEDVDHVADCTAVAMRIIDAVRQPFRVSGRQMQISASVGIVVHPGPGEADKLVACADAAMYAAKRSGGSTYALFEPSMAVNAHAQLDLQMDLRQAAQRGEFEVHYQPKVDGLRGQIRGVEALLRWNHPTRGRIGPDVFVPMAERFGLIGIIGDWVINEVCRQMGVWSTQGVRMRVAINLSVHQLRERDLVARIQAALERHQVDASQLLCEITESVAMEDIEATQRAFKGLAAIGVFLSIDDFGTGYSSLSYLRQLPAQQLKIDRSFVKDLESSADARAVVNAVIQLAHALSLQVVAEGVETSGQRDILLAMGCDELQGFYYARPMTPDSLLAWTLGRRPEGAEVDFSPSVVSEL